VAGTLAALILPRGDEVETDEIVAIIAAGYAGSDFIEGLVKDKVAQHIGHQLRYLRVQYIGLSLRAAPQRDGSHATPRKDERGVWAVIRADRRWESAASGLPGAEGELSSTPKDGRRGSSSNYGLPSLEPSVSSGQWKTKLASLLRFACRQQARP